MITCFRVLEEYWKDEFIFSREERLDWELGSNFFLKDINDYRGRLAFRKYIISKDENIVFFIIQFSIKPRYILFLKITS